VAGNNTAISNSLDGVSALQVADGGVSQVNDSLQRIRELFVQAQNGILNDNDSTALQKEADALLGGIQDKLEQATFNGQSLLQQDGELSLKTGPDAGNSLAVSTFDAAGELNNLGLFSLDISDPDALNVLDQSQDFFIHGCRRHRCDPEPSRQQYQSPNRNLNQ